MEKHLILNPQEVDFIVEVLKEQMKFNDLSNKEKYVIHDLIEKLQN